MNTERLYQAALNQGQHTVFRFVKPVTAHYQHIERKLAMTYYGKKKGGKKPPKKY